MIKTLGNNIVSAFTGGNPVKAIYAYGQLVWPICGPEPTEYYIKWTPSSAEGQFNIDGTTYDLSTFSGLYYWSTGIINSRAFEYNNSIQSIETNATRIGDWAFHICSLTQVSLPMCGYIGSCAFSACSSLKQVSLPVCSYIGSYAFQNCYSLSQVSLPVCESIGERAFGFCSSLTQASLPMCGYIGGDAFSACSNIEYQAFAFCGLSQISLPMCGYIGAGAFRYCSSLNSITIGYSSVCSLIGSAVFTNTQITSSTGSIYVPTSLVDSYKSAKNWSYFSTQIFPISE